MENYFKVLLSEDSPEAWIKLKDQMPWSWAPSAEERKIVEQLDLEQLEIDTSDADELLEQLRNADDGTILGEYFVEPMLAINDLFFPYILSCYQLIPLSKGDNPTVDDLGSVYRASNAIVADECSPISYMAIVCPRCQLRFTEGDEEIDFSPEDCAYDDCFACSGSGEWQFELLS